MSDWSKPGSNPLADIRAAMKKISEQKTVPMPCTCPACDLRRDIVLNMPRQSGAPR